MRGTRDAGDYLRWCHGIIPAYAGNTEREHRADYRFRDHPRVCGEHGVLSLVGGVCGGSSPRMRGTPLRPPEPLGRVGIIPAYAGNTPQAGFWRRRTGDHPRVCGEHQVLSSRQFQQRGSSPRMRGTPRITSRLCTAARIIPAYAGNTKFYHRGSSSSGDHPRVCGEHP